MRTYLYALAALLIVVAIYGFAAPALVSAESDFAVLLGVLLAVAAPIAISLIYLRWRRSAEAAFIINKVKGH